MKKRILLSSLLFLIVFQMEGFPINETKKHQEKFIRIQDLNVKSFISLLKKKYNKNPEYKFVTMSGDFPDNWVKPNDVDYLISIMYSKEKCCSYQNVFSSFFPNKDAEVGGFAIIFLNSYIDRKKINLGLYSSPKTDKEAIKKIEAWYRTNKNY
ncbi:hypothetical protein [Flavobacterium foetidum]|uniref:hypothetical protein n=1 Tax=Flavobacterium foetidum TaxID=2026681 RepID=UPI001074B23E|nr:hypothetical protein [Flavobacterium foetidum]KAF2517365.1 hypothetical protein E0W73_04500 [Flavobacterium foetidum]